MKLFKWIVFIFCFLFLFNSSVLGGTFSPGGVSGGGVVSTEEFTSSGTWTVPDGVTSCQVLLVGGGGGGAGAPDTSTGGGGGGGGEIVFATVFLAGDTSITITIGAGGAGGAYGAAGVGGDASTFEGFLTADGGVFGYVTKSAKGFYGGPGGNRIVTDYFNATYTSYDIKGDAGGYTNAYGSPGIQYNGPTISVLGGSGGGQGYTSGHNASYGGNNLYADGGDPSDSTGGGGGGSSYGAGGAGGHAGNGTAAAANTGGGGGGGSDTNGTGGAGGSGYCVVFYVE